MCGLVVPTSCLARSIQNTLPVLLFVVGPSLDIKQSLDTSGVLADGVDGQRAGPLQFTENRSDERWEGAPVAGQFARAEIPGALVLGAGEDAVADASVGERGAEMRADVGRGVHLAVIIARDEDLLTRGDDALELAG